MKNELSHYGILGMKWGVRRYQNEDGTLTAAGQKRYGDDNAKRKTSTAKKVAVGTAAVAGVVLTAYLVKKYGAKNASEIADKAEAGKAVVEKLVETSSIVSAPVSQIQASKPSISTGVETGKAVTEKITKAAASVPKQAAHIQTPPAYNFETLIKQNDDLLKKMLADLV